MEIGKMTLSEAYPYLKTVALAYGLKLPVPSNSS